MWEEWILDRCPAYHRANREKQSFMLTFTCTVVQEQHASRVRSLWILWKQVWTRTVFSGEDVNVVFHTLKTCLVTCCGFLQHRWDVEKLLGGSYWLQGGKAIRLLSGVDAVSVEECLSWHVAFPRMFAVDPRVLWDRPQLPGKQTESGFGQTAERKFSWWCRSSAVGHRWTSCRPAVCVSL